MISGWQLAAGGVCEMASNVYSIIYFG